MASTSIAKSAKSQRPQGVMSVGVFGSYLATHLVPAALVSLGLLCILYLFHARGVSFRKWRKYLDKEVVIQADNSTSAAPKCRKKPKFRETD